MEILLLRLDFWDWLAFGTVLLLLEILGAGGYLLRVGLTAACVGALGALLPGLAWPWQVGLFVLLSGLVATEHRRRRRKAGSVEETPGLQRRGDDLFGRTFPLHRAIVGGLGELRVGHALWLVSGPDLPRGAWSGSPARTAPCCTSNLPRPETLKLPAGGGCAATEKATERSSAPELRDGKRDLM